VDWWKGDCFLWPSASQPEWPEILSPAVPEAAYQSLFNDMHARGFRPTWLDAFELAGTTFFNVIFRPTCDDVYQPRHGLDGDQYQAEYNLWVQTNGYRLSFVESYWSNTRGRICYAPIFEKTSGPSVAAYHGRTKEQHQAIFDDWTSKGWVPMNISVVSRGGIRYYTGRYEKRDVGRFELRSTLSFDDYQAKFTANAANGLYVSYLNSYVHGGAVNMVAIWQEKQPSPVGKHHLNATELAAWQKSQRSANRYLRAITAYPMGLVPNWAAIWNK
jgi:hypothetical protein